MPVVLPRVIVAGPVDPKDEIPLEMSKNENQIASFALKYSFNLGKKDHLGARFSTRASSEKDENGNNKTPGSSGLDDISSDKKWDQLKVDKELKFEDKLQLIDMSSLNCQNPQDPQIATDRSKESAYNFTKKINMSTLIDSNAKIVKDFVKEQIVKGAVELKSCLLWDNGTYYEGEILNMKFHGRGYLRHYMNYTVEGDFFEGKVRGKASYLCGLHTYKGDWRDNQPHGAGIESIQGEYLYEGSFQNGLKEGSGKLTLYGKGTYEGEFKDNCFNGTGTFCWKDGRKYQGAWAKNRLHGKGVMTWPDGRTFNGRYRANKKDGPGTFTWADGRVYSGNWKLGMQEGKGKYSDIKGEKMHTRFDNGRQQSDDEDSGSIK